MKNGSPPHHEILLSLAEEIRMTLDWLGQQEEPPSTDTIRSRIRTLREAATMASMDSVENVLDQLDDDLDENDRAVVELDAKVEQVLRRLTDVLGTIASSMQEHEQEWVRGIQEAERILVSTGAEMEAGARRLLEAIRLSEACGASASREERNRLLEHLSLHLKDEVSRQREMCDRLGRTRSAMRDASRRLMRSLSELGTIPLSPLLLQLRETTRGLARDSGKPVTLLPRGSGVSLGLRQSKSIAAVLDFLVQEIVKLGMEDPKERRRSGKSTVGSIRVHGTRGKSITTIILEDDGREERPDLQFPRTVRAELDSLRARLLRESPQEAGRRLVLQVPTCPATVEALRVATPAGWCFVPLSAVAEIFTESSPPAGDLPEVIFDRRSRARLDPSKSGVVLEVDGWRGVLHAEVQAGQVRVVPSPPEPGDPPWVLARIADGPETRPLMHPLPFVELKDDQVCLYPAS